jgi:hypothetical protein
MPCACATLNTAGSAANSASPTVHVAGVVATSRYDIAWERDGQCHEETGHDVLVLTKRARRRQIVWRGLIPLSDKS